MLLLQDTYKCAVSTGSWHRIRGILSLLTQTKAFTNKTSKAVETVTFTGASDIHFSTSCKLEGFIETVGTCASLWTQWM